MTLMEQVNNDIKEAMKARQQERLDALRMLKAEYIKNNTSAKPTDELSVTISHAKRLMDSIEPKVFWLSMVPNSKTIPMASALVFSCIW